MTRDNKTAPAGTAYRGRFAPSPTGPLHFGSLVAATGSFLDARANGGEWLVRMEDLDPPREMAGAADDILRTLDELGLHWDGPVAWQGRRSALYEDVLERLGKDGAVYGCACTRREIADSQPADSEHTPYPGTCRNGLPPGRKARALRVRVDDNPVRVLDRLQPSLVQNLEAVSGDFVVRRADGLFAYQLAVVVDDAEQGITDIVRGMDLYDSTPRQQHLQDLLGYPRPRYLHLPIAVNAAGEKLSKQTGARRIETGNVAGVISEVLRFLGQELPAGVEDASPDELWRWAIAHWNTGKIPSRPRIPAPESGLENPRPRL